MFAGARNIKVDTDDRGVVTLSGNRGSRRPKDAHAVVLARQVKGVKSVTNNIKVN